MSAPANDPGITVTAEFQRLPAATTGAAALQVISQAS